MTTDDKKYQVLMRAAAMLLALCLSWTAAEAATVDELRNDGIRIAIADEEPYGYMDDSGKAKGPGPDVARHVLGELGIKDIEWVVVPFGDLISGLQQGRFDMAAAEMAILPERCEKIIYSAPNTTYGEGLLVEAGNPHGLRSYSDFANSDHDLKVAILGGANQRGFLNKLGVSDDRIVAIENNKDAIEAITGGEVAAYAATSLTVAGLAQSSEKVQPVFSFVDPVIDGREVRGWGGFAFNQESTELRDAFNEILVPYKFTDEWEETLLGYGFSRLDVLNSFKYETEQLCAGR